MIVPFDPANSAHLLRARASPAGWAWACSRGEFALPPHIARWNEDAVSLVEGDKRILREAPVRHGKSLFWSVAVLSWFLCRDPRRRVVSASHSLSLSQRHSRIAREWVREFGQSVFGVRLSDESASANDWSLDGSLDGGYYAVGVGGSLSGRGADCVAGDTMVETPRGLETIRALHESGYRGPVLSRNDVTGKDEWADVLASREIPCREVLEVYTVGGHVLRCTPEHRVRVRDGYCEAQHLRRLQQIVTGHVYSVDRKPGVRETVYDIQVAGNENFYANGVLVHNCLLLDDLCADAEAALSDTQRENVWQWLESTALRRLEPRGSVVGITTRWHSDDAHGRLVSRQPGRWDRQTLAALAREGDPLGRPVGAPLWPERYPLEVLQRIKAETGSYWWASLYQGDPIPEGGGIFKPAWWRDTRYTREAEGAPFVCADGYAQPLSGLLRFVVVDTAMTENKTSDYTVIMACGLTPHKRLLILDVDRRRMEGPDVLPAIRAMLTRWDARMAWVEQSTQSLYLIQQARREGLPIRTFGKAGDVGLLLPSGGGSDPKVPTYYAATPMVEAGRLWLPRQASWLSDLESELSTVPYSATGHDDAAETCAVACLLADHLQQGAPLWASYEDKTAARAYDPRESPSRDEDRAPGAYNPYAVTYPR